jgi:hypothetical protein
MLTHALRTIAADAVALALAFVSASCSGSDSDSSQGGHPPPVVEASGCDVPPLPDLGSLVTHTVGDGTASSCDESALQEGLGAGGLVDFDCGGAPVVIAVGSTLVVETGTHLDGGGRVTLDGGDAVGILRTESNSEVIVAGLTFQHGHAKKVAGVEGANGSGGAIQRGWRSNLYVKDCAFVDNVADGDDGENGGAIFAGSAGWLTVVGSTFSGNRAPSGGATHTVLSDLTVVDSVFDANQATSGALLESELGDHGGFTLTLALAEGSPALGAGSDCPVTDQRGEPRDSASCDLGAFELP